MQVESKKIQESVRFETSTEAEAKNQLCKVSGPRLRNQNSNYPRICWICFSSEEEDRRAKWIHPCKCRGTTKWVHHKCLNRWVDLKQNESALTPVVCQQCQTEYIIVTPEISTLDAVLDSADRFIGKVCPFVVAGFFFGAVYCTAASYGGVTILQIVGLQQGVALLESYHPLALLLCLPAIPVSLIVSHLINWEIRLLNFATRCVSKLRKLSRSRAANGVRHPPGRNSADNAVFVNSFSVSRVFCAALLLPTISSVMGKVFFSSCDNLTHRTLFGGLTYLTVKSILKIYLQLQQQTRHKRRFIVAYTEEIFRQWITPFEWKPLDSSTPRSEASSNDAADAEPAYLADTEDNETEFELN